VGQLVIEAFAGKRIHPSWVVPGGVNAALTREDRDKIVGLLPEAKTATLAALGWFKDVLKNFRDEIAAFANFQHFYGIGQGGRQFGAHRRNPAGDRCQGPNCGGAY
jgi:NAD-reducing hydrogenase large subunit